MILYTFKRCPFAIRARMTLIACELKYEHREVDLKNKPKSLIEFSPKATVPVLITDGKVIDESFDILTWAIQQQDPLNLARPGADESLIATTMQDFLPKIYHCKYPERYEVDHEAAKIENRNWLIKLNQILESTTFVYDNQLSYQDIAIFPFIRQWHNIDQDFTEDLTKIKYWLDSLSNTEIFDKTMAKHPFWQD